LWPTFSWTYRRRTRNFDTESYELATGSDVRP
jgi:hypothetical protein